MNKYAFVFIICFIIISAFLPGRVIAQKTTIITGIVKDSVTLEALSYVSVSLDGTSIGTMTNEDGSFAIKDNSANPRLKITSLGYFDKKISIKKGTTNHLEIYLVPASYDLKEIIIKPKKEKYSKKNNPAVDFVRNIIDRRQENDPQNHDFYQYDRYEKMTFALNDFSEEQKKKWLFKKFQFIFDYVDTSEVSGKPILTVSIKEQIDKNYYRRNPQSEKRVVSGIKRAGMDEIFNQESMQQFYNEVFKEINIYNNDITLLLNRFVSPISSIGTSFYKYYLLDTLQIEGIKCVDLGFVPFNSESFGFTGHMYVALDSTYFIKKIKLNIPKDINLNFVQNMSVEQIFDRSPDGTRFITKDDIIVEFSISSHSQGLYARRTVAYKDYKFTPPDDVAVFNQDGKIIIEEDAEVKPDVFWTDNRQIPVKTKENAVEKLLVRLREVPVYYYTEKFISILVSGYIETGKESKFDFGPMNTTISGNTAEGARFRVGGLTTANLNPNLFGRGYVAYGTRDGKFKYMGELEYSFNKKKYHTREFPIHSLKLSYMYDINQLGQHYLYTNKDNIFLSLKRQSDTKITYLRKAELSYLKEFKGGFSFGIDLRYKTEYATKWVEFKLYDGTLLKDFSMAEAGIKLRYAPNEKFYQTKSNRYPINRDAPIFTLSHKVGVKGIINSKYNINHTEFGVQKRFWFSAFGYTDIILKAGKVWDKAPFPLLIIPNASLSYTIQDESYTLMNAMEFINDQYASWDITYFINGAILNRIPLIKYLKMREVVSFRGLYGNLTKKNNPADNNGMFQFPAGTHLMDKIPYMEVGVGLDNIFRILRVDYVWRLTYRDNPGISRSGLRIALHFAF